MNLHVINTGNFKLDGGAMFGVIPKSLWESQYAADENNLCNFSMRCLVVETDGRKIIIDAGLGTKQDEKFLRYYYLNGDDSLESSMRSHGISNKEITDVILTHLHFDHCGGAVEYDRVTQSYQPAFPSAVYWISRDQWDWAINPNPREKASCLKENFMPLMEHGCIRFIEKNIFLFPQIEIKLFYGHTAGLAIPILHIGENKTLVYAADLFPTAAHFPVSWVCGYDTQPLVSIRERTEFLNEAYEKQYTFFFEHDIRTECCTLKQTEKGIRPDRFMTLAEFLRLKY
ncbi:MAG: MBL fold metallo-hydrolase [Bacteroidales bacterium]|nr:MBL fold metallo-hydrolase [Bacteroidales bacterium]